VIRLISAGLLLAGAFAASAAAFRWLLGPAASVPGGLGAAGQVITGLVQVACLAAVVVVVAADGRRLFVKALGTRRAVAGHDGPLTRTRAAAAAASGQEPPELARVQRVRLRTLGAMKAATIAGLTGIGISSGPAVSTVLVYRLATYWLPVLPGWYSWRLLQRMDYL
jgi:hypothetical protein